MRALWLSKRAHRGLVLTIGGLLAGGCGNMSGLGGSAQYACKAPAGVQCQSVSGNYFNSVRNTKRLPTADKSSARLPSTALTKASIDAANTMAALGGADGPGYAPLPLRSPPRILRLWIKAWEDADHDLVDQSYVYVRVDQGKWKLDHVQREIREAYAPLRPPAKETVATAPLSTPVAAGPIAGAPAASGTVNGTPLQGLDTPVSGDVIGAR